MPAPYEIRAGGDVKNKKQSMADLKLRRLNELNSRLKEDLERPRIKVSEASMSLIQYCQNTKDFMVPSLWGQVDKREDPYAPQQPNGCCGIFTVDIVHSSASELHRQAISEALTRTSESQITQVWDRKTEGGFPETKQLKKLVRDIIEPSRYLGHVDRHGTKPNSPVQTIQPQVQTPDLSINSPTITSAAESLVTSILPAHPDRPRNDDHSHQPTSAETTVSRIAEQMVTDIMNGLQGEIQKTGEAERAHSSEALGTWLEVEEAEAGSTHGKDEGKEEEQGVHSARQGCEDCG
ncbi:MAG: hypothetical protein Q9182_006756 [Xanthomendoza sp. 2 TL-2023]